MHTMHLLPGIAIQPNLELKTQPKQLLGSLPLVIALPAYAFWEISNESKGSYSQHDIIFVTYEWT